MAKNSNAARIREQVFHALNDRDRDIIQSGHTLTSLRIQEIAETCSLSAGAVRIAIIEYHMECLFQLVEASEIDEAEKVLMANHRRSIESLTGN